MSVGPASRSRLGSPRQRCTPCPCLSRPCTAAATVGVGATGGELFGATVADAVALAVRLLCAMRAGVGAAGADAAIVAIFAEIDGAVAAHEVARSSDDDGAAVECVADGFDD